MSGSAAAAPPPGDEAGVKVEIQLRWLLVLASCVVLFFLRGHRVALSIYVAVVTLGIALFVFWLPKRVAAAEQRFTREMLRSLSKGDHAALDRAARRQWLIRRFGRPHLIPEGRALAAGAAGNHEAERAFYLEAVRSAPPEERVRLEVNLAAAELATKHYDEAEGRYRAALRRRPDFTVAMAGLGRVLVAKNEELGEAVSLLRRALELSDARERPMLQLALAEALVRSGQPGWEPLLAEARAGGVPSEEADRVEALASSQSAMRG
jgi:tetratricopeptide (TPR) repeat protein